MNVLLPLLLGLATIAGAGMILPQVLRVRRTRLVDGVSPAWVGVGVVLNLWWTAYAIQVPLFGLLPVSVLGVAFYAYLAQQLAAITGSKSVRQLTLGAMCAGVAPLPLLVFAGWQGAGLAIGMCYGIQFAPAAVEAIRSSNVDGISPATWTLAWIEAVIWFAYGTTNSDLALLVGGGGGTLMSTTILLRLRAAANGPATGSLARSSGPRDEAARVVRPRR